MTTSNSPAFWSLISVVGALVGLGGFTLGVMQDKERTISQMRAECNEAVRLSEARVERHLDRLEARVARLEGRR